MEQFLAPLVEIINSVLMFFFDKTGNYGLSIILLTLVVNIITFPLTRKQISASRRLQELQPELKKLQEKYKGDKEKYNKATMEYMKENKVNPLGGCLPLLIQFPIIIGVFQLLRDPGALMIDNTFFLGLDLVLSPTEAAKYFSFINPYYILPVISAAATFMHQRMVLTDPKQKMMLYIFPVMILVISVSFPAGLVLYWTTNSLLSVGNHFLIKALEKGKGSKYEQRAIKDSHQGKDAVIKDQVQDDASPVAKNRQKTAPAMAKKKQLGRKEITKLSAPMNKKKTAKGKKKGAGKTR